jgi:hypothetical protein
MIPVMMLMPNCICVEAVGTLSNTFETRAETYAASTSHFCMLLSKLASLLHLCSCRFASHTMVSATCMHAQYSRLNGPRVC